MTKNARAELDIYLKIRGRKQGYLFPNPFGGQLSRVVVSRKVKYYAQKAKLEKDVTTHTLRHTCATTMLRNGARVEDVQQILGHANIKTTMIYLHFTNDLLQKSYDKAMI